MTIPTPEEINCHDSLDERAASAHFAGKNLDEAEALFRQNSLYYQEDLMFMGPIAFRFYIHAAIRYFQSDAATGDSDIVYCLAGLLEFRLKYEPEELSAIAKCLCDACTYVLSNWPRFGVSPDLYGDLVGRFENLRRAFALSTGSDAK